MPAQPHTSSPMPQPPASTYVSPPNSPTAGRDSGSGCLIGCLIGFAVCVVLCGGVGIYVASQAKGWGVQIARQVVNPLVEESEISQEEKDAILEQFERVATAYEEGELTSEQLTEVVQDLVESKVWVLLVVKAIETKHLEPSGLTAQEKEAGRRSIDRVLRGAMDELITDSDLKELSEHFLEPTDDDSQTLKDSLTDEELRALLTDAEDLAARREVPEDSEEFRFSERFREIVDEALRN